MRFAIECVIGTFAVIGFAAVLGLIISLFDR